MKIEIKHLYKKYGSKEVLKDINMEIGQGMFGLLGSKGAGKTTLIRILTTLIEKSKGDITIGGIDIENKRKIRSIIGYLPQEFSIYPDMSVYEAMDYLSILSGINSGRERKIEILKLLENVNLHQHIKTKVNALSNGMKRRLGIAQALINNPPVLIVDEPTAGLGPEEMVMIRNLLSGFLNEKTVILSTHTGEDIESACENLGVLKDGSMLYQGTSSGLLSKAEGKVWAVQLPISEFETFKTNFHVVSAVTEGGLVMAKIVSSQKPLDKAIPSKPSIEDAYMCLVREV